MIPVLDWTWDEVCIILTSSSAASMVTILPPFGTTCAKSPSLNVSLLSLLNWTLSPSRLAVLNRPPARSFERSSFNRETAVDIPVWRGERSNGSSEDVAGLDCVSEAVGAFLPLSFFLYKIGEFAKVRCWGTEVKSGRASCLLGRHWEAKRLGKRVTMRSMVNDSYMDWDLKYLIHGDWRMRLFYCWTPDGRNINWEGGLVTTFLRWIVTSSVNYELFK